MLARIWMQWRICGRIERAIEVAAPIDPEMAGGLLGALVGLADPDEIPLCPFRRS